MCKSLHLHSLFKRGLGDACYQKTNFFSFTEVFRESGRPGVSVEIPYVRSGWFGIKRIPGGLLMHRGGGKTKCNCLNSSFPYVSISFPSSPYFILFFFIIMVGIYIFLLLKKSYNLSKRNIWFVESILRKHINFTRP